MIKQTWNHQISNYLHRVCGASGIHQDPLFTLSLSQTTTYLYWLQFKLLYILQLYCNYKDLNLGNSGQNKDPIVPIRKELNKIWRKVGKSFQYTGDFFKLFVFVCEVKTYYFCFNRKSQKWVRWQLIVAILKKHLGVYRLELGYSLSAERCLIWAVIYKQPRRRLHQVSLNSA